MKKLIFTSFIMVVALFSFAQSIKLVADLSPGPADSKIKIVSQTGNQLLFTNSRAGDWDLMLR